MNFIHRAVVAMALVAVLFSAVPSGAQSGPGADLRRHAEAGTLETAETDLAAAVAARPADAEARFALGLARFARSVERLGRSFHRHGLRAPRTLSLPILRLPVPDNPSPRPLSYEELRAIHGQFLADLKGVIETLRDLPAGEAKVRLDLTAVRFDLDGDGQASERESLGAMLAEMTGQARGRRPQAPAPAAEPWSWIVAFDRADAAWLQGYANLLAGTLEFGLAHDWRETFEATGHLFFKGASSSARLTALERPNRDFGPDGGTFADALALVHLVRWPVVEPPRLRAALAHLKEVVALSRTSWKEILAETDDDAEWVPGPDQKNSAVTALAVGREQVDGWLAVLDEFEEVLDGRKLVPHWRFAAGIDLRKVLEEPRTFDLVLWITGHGAVPYLREGPTLSRDTWRQWERVFGGNFLGYAFWFN